VGHGSPNPASRVNSCCNSALPLPGYQRTLLQRGSRKDLESEWRLVLMGPPVARAGLSGWAAVATIVAMTADVHKYI
jgi:hypothetical protein